MASKVGHVWSRQILHMESCRVMARCTLERACSSRWACVFCTYACAWVGCTVRCRRAAPSHRRFARRRRRPTAASRCTLHASTGSVLHEPQVARGTHEAPVCGGRPWEPQPGSERGAGGKMTRSMPACCQTLSSAPPTRSDSVRGSTARPESPRVLPGRHLARPHDSRQRRFLCLATPGPPVLAEVATLQCRRNETDDTDADQAMGMVDNMTQMHRDILANAVSSRLVVCACSRTMRTSWSKLSSSSTSSRPPDSLTHA